MKLGWFIYIMVGVGIATAQPYADRSEWQKLTIVLGWPAEITRGLVNGLSGLGGEAK